MYMCIYIYTIEGILKADAKLVGAEARSRSARASKQKENKKNKNNKIIKNDKQRKHSALRAKKKKTSRSGTASPGAS